ncbi:MAG: hypothetical protein JXR22_02005, partial [Prolixibacteraceae bacterium]|nr:hypothetical protein [Prolixibacteraceae bacterium]
MKLRNSIVCLLPFVALFLFALQTQAKTTVHSLRCEYHENPVGIGEEHPRLSWKLLSDVPHTLQTAYEIRTALSEKDLQKGKNLHWSSGKVDASSSVNVEYQGPALQSGQRIYWQV